MDGREAKVFHLSAQGVKELHVKAHGPKHHKESQGKHSTHSDEEKFHHELAHTLEKEVCEEMLITGPGLAQEHFKHHLDHHHAGLAKKVVGITKSDHPTKGELLKMAQQFFRRKDLFDSIG
jgi:stalled ribosome rescue protein Dom34